MTEFIEIATPRLRIRPFRETDGAGLFDYLSRPEVYRFEPGEPISLEQAGQLCRDRSQGLTFLAVELIETAELVGHLYFERVEPSELATWELGYIFSPAFQKRGYATEAAGALVRYAFAHWGVHRVMAHCNPQNIASWRVLEKIGMQREGHMRRNIFFRRTASGEPLWVDTFEYGLLREDLAEEARR